MTPSGRSEGDAPHRRRGVCRAANRLGGASAALLLTLAGTAAAQTLQQLQHMSIEQLSQIRVTSVAKQSESLSDAPAAVYVITHDEIMRSGAVTIPEMLRLAPNLEVAQLNSFAYAISARGFNVGNNAVLSNKLLVLIDGRSVYSPLFGGVYWDMQSVPPDDIDRIEVISGPGAALWGANAVNGVVNIITRKSSDTPGGLLTLSEGNYQRYEAVQYGGRVAPHLSFRVHGEYTGVSAYPQTSGQSAQDSWNRPQGGFRLDWTPPNNAVTLQGNAFNITENPTDTIRGGDLALNWQHSFDDGSSLQLLAYYDNAQRFTENGGNFWVHTYDVEVQHNFRLGSWNNIVWGVGERAIAYRINTPGGPNGLQFSPPGETLNLANVFAQDTLSLTPRVKLTLGMKLEDEPYVGAQVMPSARIGWKATDHVLLWAAVSRAVRSPTPVDENINEYVGGSDILRGTSEFRPETLTAYELGTRVQISSRASFSISTFYSVYNDIRSINLAPPGAGAVFVFGNQVAGKVYGAELWGTYQPTRWWRLSAGLTVQHQDLRFLQSALPLPALVANDPNQQWQLRSSFNLGHGVTFDAFLREVGPLPHPAVPGYAELNLRVGWNVTRWLQVSLNGDNLLHARHVEFIEPGVTTAIPRSVFAQAQVRF